MLNNAAVRFFLPACLLLAPVRSAETGPALALRLTHRWLFGAGSTAQGLVRAADQNGATVERPTLVWSSADPAVAAVNENGEVTATGLGATSICVSWVGLTACQAVRVVPDVPREIDAGKTIAIVGAHLVPMTGDAIVERQTVLVRGGRIAAIGPAAELEVPADAGRIDAEGLYLMPGLADMHVHFLHGNPHWRNDLYLYAANGVTTVREMWGDREFLPWRAAAASGAVFAPTVYLASPGMDGPETPYGTPPVASAGQARALVSYYKWLGFDFIKVYSNLRVEVYEAILDEAARQGIRVIGHAPSRVPYDTVIVSGQSSIEHIVGLWRQVYSGSVNTGTLNEAKLDPLATLMRESAVWMVPTVFVSDRNTDTVVELQQRSDARYISPAMKRWFANSPPTAPSRDLSALRTNLRLTLRKLHSAGVRVMLGTDSGCCYVPPGFAIHDELRAAIESGLSPFEALRMATVYPAWYLGVLDRAGTVETGKRADLILVEENPLGNVENVARRVGVVIGGWWQSEKAMRARLEEIAREYGQ